MEVSHPLQDVLAFGISIMGVQSLRKMMFTMRQVTYLPISSPFIRFAGRYVDEAFGFAAGWNFFVFEAALVPFEVTACNVVIHYWSKPIFPTSLRLATGALTRCKGDAVPAGGIIAIVIVLYGLINLLAVEW